MRKLFVDRDSFSLRIGEAEFRLLERREGIVVTLGPYTHFFDRPGRSVCKWTGVKTVPRQSPHPLPQRSWLMNELATLAHILFGGGDVKLNMIATFAEQREVLLTAGDGNVVESIDLARLAREGAPPLLFLHTAYLDSSHNVRFRSVPCDASTISWSRAPYAYKSYPTKDLSEPAILCLAGRTNVWRERLGPGQSRDFALGNIIATTSNISSRLRPSNQYGVEDFNVVVFSGADLADEDSLFAQRKAIDKSELKRVLREVRASLKTLFESVRAREGFFVCQLSNHSQRPGYVYVQLNKSGFYGGSGLVGIAVRLASALFRSSHLLMGR